MNRDRVKIAWKFESQKLLAAGSATKGTHLDSQGPSSKFLGCVDPRLPQEWDAYSVVLAAQPLRGFRYSGDWLKDHQIPVGRRCCFRMET